MQNKTFKIPLQNPLIYKTYGYFLDNGYKKETVSLEQLVRDNNLDDPSELDYHKKAWPGEQNS